MTSEARLAIRRDPELWFRGFSKILSKDSELITPQPNVLQSELFRVYRICMERGIPGRVIGLKPRQTGLSTVSQALLYHHSRNFACSSLTMAHKRKLTEQLTEMYVRYGEEDLFDWRSEFVTTGNKRIIFEGGEKSERYAETALGENPGVGGTHQFHHLTECSKYKSGDSKDCRSWLPQLRQCVAERARTFRIEESTPEGMGNMFEGTYQGDSANENPLLRKPAVTIDQYLAGDTGNGWIKIFKEWFHFDDYELPLVSQAEFDAMAASLTPSESALMQKHGTDLITMERIKWRRKKIGECESERLFIQEYTEDEAMCFLASGRPRFDIDAITVAERNVRPAETFQILKTDKPRDPFELEKDSTSPFVIWEPRIWGCSYLISIDCMTGEEQVADTQISDRNSISVWRQGYEAVIEGETVWREPMKVARTAHPDYHDPTPGAALAKQLSDYYGRCNIIVEMNNCGLAWLVALEALKAPLYRRTILDESTKKRKKKLGWQTSPANRELLVEAVSSGLKNGIVIPDEELIRECRWFVRHPNGKSEAIEGKHDDHVMSAGIGLHLLPTQATKAVRPRIEKRKRFYQSGT